MHFQATQADVTNVQVVNPLNIPSSAMSFQAIINGIGNGTSFVILPRSGVGHAWRIYYIFLSGIAPSGSIDSCRITGYQGTLNSGQYDNNLVWDWAFPGAANESLTASGWFFATIVANPAVNSAAWNPQPSGLVMRSNTGLLAISTLSTTGNDIVNISVIYSLDH